MKISINISISKLHNVHVDLTSTLLKIFLLVGKEFSPWACGDTNRRQCKYLWEFQNILSVPGNFPVKGWQLLPISIWQIIAFVVFSLPAYTYISESVWVEFQLLIAWPQRFPVVRHQNRFLAISMWLCHPIPCMDRKATARKNSTSSLPCPLSWLSFFTRTVKFS